MGKKVECPFCDQKYDPSERYLAHKPYLCELDQLRKLRDRLIDWPTTPVDFSAVYVLKGSVEMEKALNEIDDIKQRAGELQRALG